MKLFNWIVTGLAAVSLVACGGGGSLPAPGGGTTTPTPAAATVEVASSLAQIGSGGQEATITATVKGANNVAIASAPITFSVDSATLSDAGTTTGSNGTATAKLTAGTNPATRTVTVTATSGAVSGTVKVQILAAERKIELISDTLTIGSGGGEATITALLKNESNVSVAGAPISFSTDTGTLTSVTAVTNASGVATAKVAAGADKSNRTVTVTATSGTVARTVQVVVEGTEIQYDGATTVKVGQTPAPTLGVTVVDSRKIGIANARVTVSSRLNNGLSATVLTTNAAGKATFAYTPTNPGTDTLTFASAGATATQNLIVSGENFAFVSPVEGTRVAVNTASGNGVNSSTTVTVRYLVAGAAVAGVPVSFSATSGTISSLIPTTDAQGFASAIVSSRTAGPATVVARLGAGSTGAEATLGLRFVASTPAALVLQASPRAIPPNVSASAPTPQSASVVATVRDSSGNPVEGLTVNFATDVDPSGGRLSQPSSVTNAAGQASVSYISGATATASGGVQLRAYVESVPSVIGTTSLTVNQSALFIALGTSNVIDNLTPEQYKKDWVVYVTDANGVAVPNIQVTLKALPSRYMKGELAWNGTLWTTGVFDPATGRPRPYFVCLSEDANRDGRLDSGEDFNANGRLDPGNVISVTPGVVTTDASGRATLSLIYAESYHPWVELTLRAEAIVSGTESSREQTFVVPARAADLTVQTEPPAGRVSPFGVQDCPLPD